MNSDGFILKLYWESILKTFCGKPEADYKEVNLDAKKWAQFFGRRWSLTKEQSKQVAKYLISKKYPIKATRAGYTVRKDSEKREESKTTGNQTTRNHSDKVKNKVKKETIYFTILDFFRISKGPKNVYNRLSMSKQALNPYLKVLKRYCIVKKIGRSVWCLEPPFSEKSNEEIYQYLEEKIHEISLSKKILSVGARGGLNHANLHALKIVIPVLEGKVDFKDGDEVKLKNWIQQIMRVPSLGVTLANNNDKSITVDVWSREIYDYLEIPLICVKTVHVVSAMLKKEGVILDYFGWSVKNLNIMIRNEDLDKINKGLKIDVVLGRNCEKISEADAPREAHAWMDSTPYKGVETNDIGYYKNYILMPERIAKMEAKLQEVSLQLSKLISEVSKDGTNRPIA